jgi:hypothetical protein
MIQKLRKRKIIEHRYTFHNSHNFDLTDEMTFSNEDSEASKVQSGHMD